MTTASPSFAESGFAVRVNRVQSIVLLLLVLAAAMLIPIAHSAVQGEDRLVANFVATYARRGPISPGLASAARQAAENRISLQPVLQPFHALLLILTMAACAWLLCRWRTVRISFGTALRGAVLAFAAGQLFYLILYFAGWALLGRSSMMPEWQHVVPTSIADLHVGPRSWQHILEGFSLGAVVCFAALGLNLRQLVPALRRGDEWIVVGGTAALTATIFVAALLL